MQALKILGLLILAGILAVIALVLLKVTPRIQPAITPVISNFEECVAAGNPVMESYPRQCRTKEGQLFVEEIDEPLDDDIFNYDVTACKVGGCSGQLCLDANSADIGTICTFLPEYSCYRDAKCERQADGKCGWTQSAELKQCLANPPAIEGGGNLEVM